MAKAPAKKSAKKAAKKAAKTTAKKAVTAAKKAAAKAPAKKAAKKATASKAKKEKNISGYGMGGVDVVMSVDQVAKEAASIAANAPDLKKLKKLANDDSFLVIDNLCAGYGKMQILHDFTMHVKKGQSLCLIGPNGAGKSTVLHSCLLYTSPSPRDRQKSRMPSSA